MRKPIRRLSPLCLLLPLLVGCGSMPKGYVTQQWAENMAQLRIYPVLPLTEDFMVGDVFLASLPPVGDGDPGLRPPHRLDSINVVNTLNTYYQGRPIWPSKSDDAGKSVPSATGSIFEKSGAAHRLRRVQFPGFTFARLSAADLGIAAPVSGIAAILGGSWSSDLSVSISVPQAEYVGLPALETMNAFHSHCKNSWKDLDLNDVRSLASMIDPKGVPTIIVVNEVYYTREISFVFSSSKGFAAEAAATLPNLDRLTSDLTELAKALKSGGTGGTGGGSGGGTGSGTGNGTGSGAAAAADAKDRAALQAKADDLLKRAQEIQASAGGLPAPGARLSAVSVSSTGITLTASFPEPVAVGYRGLTWAVTAQSGTFGDNSVCGKLPAVNPSPGDTGVAPIIRSNRPDL
ncbi:hypothetical protein FBZ82_11211 [Azospirillum brasilense]|uniref:Cellulose biosynthesis protein BcsN n=1 Tax=Azospirillum brasilense TaxID=192 RepID=A0A560ATP3_AZOBR|nr:hypothetical protein [Azospirillum brasilense]TWA63731.1 hypothetical protein FBZ82_11211 [Azospirillum brasilense]